MSNSIIRVPKGNDWHIQLLVSEEGSDQHIDLNDVSDLKVELIHQHCGRTVTPPYSIGVSGVLQLELEAHQQELGLYDARISFTRPSDKYADGAEHRTISISPAIKVVHAHEAGDKGVTITGYLAALSKGDKGDPGDPTELLDELSRQQADRLNEIATAQRESLTSIGARLSDEQRTTLEELAGRLSREQAGQIAQHTERLSSEQASGLQVISDRLSSEQSAQLERQGQERAGAQAEALKALDEQVNHKHDKALEGLSGKVSEAVEVQLPRLVEGKVAEAVDAKLPAVAGNKIAEVAERELPSVVGAQLPAALTEQLPSQLSESLPSIIGLDDQSRLTIGGQAVGESLKGTDGRDGRDGAEVRFDQGWIRPLVVNMRHSPLRGRSNTIPSMDEMQAGVLASPDYLPELWSNSETLYVSFYTNRHRAQHFYWDGLRAYNDGTSGRRVIMRVDISGLQGQHVRLVWTEAQMAKIHELFFNSSGTRSIYVDITDIDDRLHFLTTPGLGGVGGVIMVAIYESLASDNPQLPRGTWAQRPKTPYIGHQYIATDMRHNGVGDLPMWYNGVMWIDYEGHDVTRRYLIE